jgi:hypothetical protein
LSESTPATPKVQAGFRIADAGKARRMHALGELAWVCFFLGFIWEFVIMPWRR